MSKDVPAQFVIWGRIVLAGAELSGAESYRGRNVWYPLKTSAYLENEAFFDYGP